MVKPSKDPKPAGPVRRAAHTVARHTNVRAAGRHLERMVDEEAPRTPTEDEQRAELVRAAVPRFSGLAAAITPHMAALAAACILAATAAAALAGVVDAGLDKVIPPPVPDAAAPTLPAEPAVPVVRQTCDEPISGCPQRGDAAEGRRSR
jgi:hypothetical protein